MTWTYYFIILPHCLTSSVGGPKMLELAYLNLGYRSDNIVAFIEKDDFSSSEPFLDDAISIIQDCLNIESTKSIINNFSSSGGYTSTDLTPILYEVYSGKEIKEVISALRTLVGGLNKLMKKRTIDVAEKQSLLDFFNKLSNTCRVKSNLIVQNKLFGHDNELSSSYFAPL